ncbi:UTRA domain-containing protein [Actinomadura sp. DC4]|uniref:GntR family transcriptional regulator n=1 Tax=Actinomadura sp. DC4 TaxID=3055069 RepID=UPI0025AEDC86|nr:UTRA domain-containing protein [Actinomadura sp. DC4]MDN3357418.1 UTRA domain-containing protein [Actinomadura sp. DC4]
MNLNTLHEIATISDPIERACALGRAMTEQQNLVEEAARMRRQAIAEARETGHRLEEIANVLGVSPGRISQMRKGPASRTPLAPPEERPQVIVNRALPSVPGLHGPADAFVSASECQGLRPSVRILFVGTEPSSEHVATCLRIQAGDEVIARRRMVLADDVPVRLVTSYFRADLFAGTCVAEPELVKPSLQECLESLGHSFGHAEESLVARPATRSEVDALDLDPSEWAVQLLRAAYSSEDTPVHMLESVCAASRHVFTISQAGADQEF